ncbi:hypothetical protein ACSSS7_006796 [Eimeria intestinalis]
MNSLGRPHQLRLTERLRAFLSFCASGDADLKQQQQQEQQQQGCWMSRLTVVDYDSGCVLASLQASSSTASIKG